MCKSHGVMILTKMCKSHGIMILTILCSKLKIKSCWFFERKAKTNLESILKSKDITLLTKDRIVKAMVFPVVMYGCESWTIKKDEHWRMGSFELWGWRRLESSLDSKENKPVDPEGINPDCSLEGLMLKLRLQYFGHLMRRLTPWKRPWYRERLRAGG